MSHMKICTGECLQISWLSDFFFCVCFSRAQCFHCWDDKGEGQVCGCIIIEFLRCPDCVVTVRGIQQSYIRHDSVSILGATTERPEQVRFFAPTAPMTAMEPQGSAMFMKPCLFYAPKIFRHPWNCVVRAMWWNSSCSMNFIPMLRHMNFLEGA